MSQKGAKLGAEVLVEKDKLVSLTEFLQKHMKERKGGPPLRGRPARMMMKMMMVMEEVLHVWHMVQVSRTWALM